MIPYFPPPRLHLFGPFTIHLFGVLVATGVLLGARLCYKRAAEAKIPEREIENAIYWVVAMGFIFGHILDIIFYAPDRLITEGPLVLLKVWDGLSSYGGFIGAFAGFMIFRARLGKSVLPHADVLIQGLSLGWIFGRLGCTLIQDHPGRHTDFFLAFDSPFGPRHNLGFYELLLTLFVLFPMGIWLNKKKLAPGTLSVALSVTYAIPRFFMDFLRETDSSLSDIRYVGLTFAQYSCLALIAYCAWLWRTRCRN